MAGLLVPGDGLLGFNLRTRGPDSMTAPRYGVIFYVACSDAVGVGYKAAATHVVGCYSL
jgi:hypothetical protein